MNQDVTTKKRITLIAVFLSIFVVGSILMFTTPSSVKATYGLTAQTDDGVTISFNVFEPVTPAAPGSRPAIIIGHGSAVNKEMMKSYAIELAASGFIAVPYDLRGHGMSSGILDRDKLINDVKAIKQYILSSISSIDPNSFGYIGYSLAGEPGYQIIEEDVDFKCFIGIGAHVPNDIIKTNSSRFLNILMLRAMYDEATTLEELKIGMGIRLGINSEDVDVNKLYGSFNDGNASMIYTDDNSDHLTSAWDEDFIRETRDWVINSFSAALIVDENFYTNIRAFILIIQLIGGFGFFFLIIEPLSHYVLKSSERKIIVLEKKNLTEYEVLKKSMMYSFVLCIPGMLIISPLLLFLQFPITSIMLMILFGQSFAILILLKRYTKRLNQSFINFLKKPFSGKKSIILKHIMLGVILAIVFYLIILVSFGLNYIGIGVSLYRILWSPIYYSVTFLIFMVYGLLFHEMFPRRIKNGYIQFFRTTGLYYGLIMIYLCSCFILPCIIIRDFYILMFLFVAAPVLLISVIISNFIYQKTDNIIAATIVNSLFITCILISLTPFLSIVDLLQIFIGNRG